MIERAALYLQDAHDLRDGLDYVQYAEERGFEAVWQAESRLVRDAIVPMAAYAAVTEEIKVGSGVINNWTRNIGLLAATYLTLDDLAPNRIICGIGAWWDPLAKNVGIDRKWVFIHTHFPNQGQVYISGQIQINDHYKGPENEAEYAVKGKALETKSSAQ